MTLYEEEARKIGLYMPGESVRRHRAWEQLDGDKRRTGIYGRDDNGERYLDLYAARDACIKKYGFAILTDAAIESLRPFAPFVEIGAGSGYWAYELQKAGIDVVATDPFAPGTKKQHYGFEKAWTELKRMYASTAARQYPDHTLLICWPNYRCQWATNVLKAYQGRYVVYVGEGYGGCTANDAFYEELNGKFETSGEWEEIEEIAIPQWSGIHDDVRVYRRQDTRRTESTEMSKRQRNT